MIRGAVFLALILIGSTIGPAAPWAEERPVVLVADPWCPHTCDPRRGPDGYMVEIARAALELAGYKVVYKTEGWARALYDVRHGHADGAVGALPDEAPDLVTNGEPLGRQVNALVSRADRPVEFFGLDSLGALQIGSVAGYSFSPAIDLWLSEHPRQVQAVSGSDAAIRNLRKLLAGRVDVALDDEAVLAYAARRLGQSMAVSMVTRLPGGSLHIAFGWTRGEKLAAALDQGIRTLRTDGRLREILERYDLKDWKAAP